MSIFYNAVKNRGADVLDTNFDPYQALCELNRNQEILHNNDRNLAQAFNDLQQRVNEQQQVIDSLIKQVASTNKANEILLDGFLKEINKTIKDVKWPNQ